MQGQFERTQLLLGKDAMEILNRARIAVFGVGGVGGFVVEALVRTGISHIDIIDNDTVSLSNINRQIIATTKTVGKYKVEVMKERILEINPNAEVNAYKCFYLPETKTQFDFTKYDYIVDAVDTVTAKIQLILQAKEAGTKIISSMGAGNKLNPTLFEVSDIFKTSVCPLARIMRQECKKRGIKNVKVVYSKERPLKPIKDRERPLSNDLSLEKTQNGSRPRDIPGSTAFVPSVAGLIIAGEIIRDLTFDVMNQTREREFEK